MNRRRRSAIRGVRPGEAGYVLVMVLGALVLMALLAGRFASRMDLERSQASALLDEARAELDLDAGLALMLYELGSRHLTLGGFGVGPQALWRTDGRWYRVGERLRVSVQDERGLVSVNSTDRSLLRRLLINEGLPTQRADALIDVLADYVDTDSLRRLNGAEAQDYAAQGLPPPRNDFVRAIDELRQMPLWRDEPDLIERILPWLSVRVTGFHDPNSSPREVLAALLPGASPQQLDLLTRLRDVQPFLNNDAAVRATGLPLAGDQYMFYSSNEFRLRLWIEGQPRAREYNLRLEPGGIHSPWLIVGTRAIRPPLITSASSPPFELPVRHFTSATAGP